MQNAISIGGLALTPSAPIIFGEPCLAQGRLRAFVKYSTHCILNTRCNTRYVCVACPAEITECPKGHSRCLLHLFCVNYDICVPRTRCNSVCGLACQSQIELA